MKYRTFLSFDPGDGNLVKRLLNRQRLLKFTQMYVYFDCLSLILLIIIFTGCKGPSDKGEGINATDSGEWYYVSRWLPKGRRTNRIRTRWMVGGWKQCVIATSPNEGW